MPELDLEVLGNYRQTSELPFMSKVQDKVAAKQRYDFLQTDNLFHVFHAGF